MDCNTRESEKVLSNYEIPLKLLWNDEYINYEEDIVIIGESQIGKVQFDLNRTPHVLITGEAGSGKSVILRVCLWQMFKKQNKVYLFDFKSMEFGKRYEKFADVITDKEQALKILDELVRENEYRMKIFREADAKNLKEYNTKTGKNLKRIGVFIDDLEVMLDSKKELSEKLEGGLSTLARLSRATGINLFLGVQRPDSNVLTGQIKNNIPLRISGRFADKSASEIVLGNSMAVDLPNIKGRFLFRSSDEIIEFQAYYFDDGINLADVSFRKAVISGLRASELEGLEKAD